MFGGFKASLNLFGGKRNKKGLHSELSSDMTVSGAYRTSRDDFFGYHNSFEQSKKSTASEQMLQQIRPTKSTSDLTKTKNTTPNLRHSTGEVSNDPRGAQQVDPRAQNPKITKNQEREQKKLEKQRLAEQKAREKQAAQEQAKQEKLRKEREKREAQQAKAKRSRRPGKKQAPQPLGSAANPLPQPSIAQYSTNTLDSSISRSSGPPPYSAVPAPGPEQSQSDSTGNVTYSKPVDTGSWDIISQHRQQQQAIRPTTTIGGGGKQKQMVMDLNYNFGATSQTKDNSDQVKDNSDA